MNLVVRSTSVPIAERFEPDDQVAFPVARHRTVLDLGGSFADHHLGGDVTTGLAAGSRPRDAQRPPGAQTGDQLALERAAALDVERLVDRLVGDPHGLIIGEVDRQPVRDLLRAPRRRPPPILTPRLVPALPRRIRPGHRRPVGTSDHAGQPVLHVLAQTLVGDQLRRLRATSPALGLPLRDRRPILEPPRPRGRVAPQPTRSRPARTRGRTPPGRSPRPRFAVTRDEGQRAVNRRRLVES